MSPRAIVALGIAQLVNWGVLYYAFAILLGPLARELGVPAWIVTGAFSLALLMSALLAPAVGRWSDRGRGPLLMQAGGLAAAALLIAWTAMPGVPMLYLVWAGLGCCMAATLYEPAFVIVGRAFEEPAARLRALALVTLFGGLASTVFLPLTAWMVNAIGWRGAVLVLAGLLLLSTGLTRVFVFARLAARPRRSSSPPLASRPTAREADGMRFGFIASSFALASLTSAGFAANLVPALGERGASPAMAATLGGVMGVMQLPGRALLMQGALAASPARLVAGTWLLFALGLAAVAFSTSTILVAAGTMIFALGAGITTLVRPHVTHTLFSGDEGHVNGRLARYQQLARAAGPLAIAWLGGVLSYAAVFALIAFTFLIVALLAQRVLRRGRRILVEVEAA